MPHRVGKGNVQEYAIQLIGLLSQAVGQLKLEVRPLIDSRRWLEEGFERGFLACILEVLMHLLGQEKGVPRDNVQDV